MHTDTRYTSYIFLRAIILLCAVLFFAACSATKNLSEQEHLLVKNKIKVDNRKIDVDDMHNYVRQKPNRKTFFFRYRLHMYYAFEHSQKSVGTWIKRTIGEPPVVYDKNAQLRTEDQLRIYLFERGYYDAQILSYADFFGKNAKKVKVLYSIDAGKAYKISDIQFQIADSAIAHIVDAYKEKTLIKKHSVFDVSLLQQEQSRIARVIQNHGYYGFTENNIYFTADTSKGIENVHITMFVKPNSEDTVDTYKKYRIRNTYVFPDYEVGESVTSFDTLQFSENVFFMYCKGRYVKPQVIQRANSIINDSLFRLSAVERTQRRLIQNKLFKLVNISFQEVPVSDSSSTDGQIDCFIYITPYTRQAVTFELEGTNTGGDWGAEVNTSYIHKNLFKGSENIVVKAKAAGEYNQSQKLQNEGITLFNSHEFGIEARLETPVFVSPIKPAKFDYLYRPKTTMRVAYNFTKTAFYTRPTTTVSFGYTWFGNNYITHTFQPIDVSYINYYNESEKFLEFIQSRDYYKYSYEDYVIYSSNYSYVFYNRNPKLQKDYQYLRLYLESSGNLLYGMYKLQQPNSSKFQTFNVAFAQYIKTEGDFRYYQVINKKTSIVYRVFGGLAIPYFNSEGLPSVKKFYSGGANSMRAWSNRTLGPGTFMDTTARVKYYMGDVKLECNLEARFPMFWFIQGAVFLDIGNIWSWRGSELYGAEFFFNQFYKELAVGTGYGLRFDFSFFVFRLDLGVKLKEPTIIQGTNSSLIWGNRKMTGNDFNLNFGIGYPF